LLSRLEATLGQLEAAGIAAVLVGPEPEWLPTLPQTLFDRFTLGQAVAERLPNPQWPALRDLDNRMRAVAAAASVPYVSLVDTWCDQNGVCTTVQSTEAKQYLTTYDYGHMTVAAARWLVQNRIDPPPGAN
jgi:hypothetical protein